MPVFAVAVATATALGVPADARGQELAAGFTGQCCYTAMEQGDELEQFFTLRNSGTAVWNRGGDWPVKLGTQEPENRSSPFFVPGDWLSAGRPTMADTAAVEPGQEGRFAFRIKAPQQTGLHREHFRLVAEGRAWFGPMMYLDWTVLPAESPGVRFTSVPARAVAGEPIDVAVEATDNLAVAAVTFAVGDREVTAERAAETDSWAGRLATEGLAPGVHTLVAMAVDRGGREATVTASVELVAPGREGRASLPAEEPSLPPLKTTNVIRARGASRGVRLLALTVKAPRGSRITLRCRPARCAPRTIPSTRRARMKLRFASKPTLPPRTRIVLRITKPGFAGEKTIFRVTRRSVVKRVLRLG